MTKLKITKSKITKYKTIILGAGVTGLFTADTLLENDENSVLILEKKPFIGGLSTSFKYKNFTIDCGPHKLFSQLPGVIDKFKKINGVNNLVVDKKNSLYFLDKKFQFPIKISELIKNISFKTVSAGIQIPLSFAKSLFVYNLFGKNDNTFEDYLVKGFGRKAYSILFRDYAWKVWANPTDLSRDIADIRIPVPNIQKLLASFGKKEQAKVNASQFYYPKNGMVEFIENLAAAIKKKGGKIAVNQKIISIDKKENNFTIKTEDGIYESEQLISTIPVDVLINLYKKSNDELKQTADKLRYNDLSLIYLFFNKEKIIDENWIFFPELKYSFNRLSEQKTFSNYTVPNGKTVLCVEITNPKINIMQKEQIIDLAIKDLMSIGIIKSPEEIYDKCYFRLKNIYPIYDLSYKQNLNILLDYLDEEGIITLGRFGLFNYNNIDHCLDMSEKCAKWIDSKEPISQWKFIRNTFSEYRIVD